MIRTLLLGTVSAVALGTSAYAADIYTGGGYKDEPVPVYFWTGYYAGANIGYGEAGKRSGDISDATGLPVEGPQHFVDGGFAGMTSGYNFQSGHIVFGIEDEFAFSGIGAHHIADGDATDLHWFGTITGRIGYTWGPALLYAKGGFAYGEVKNTNDISKSSDRGGWAAGAGFEFFIAPKWSLKAEYEHIDLGTFSNVDDVHFSHTRGSYDLDTAKIGVNYHVGDIYEALK
jgi:outer membrane immunogenic protein